ncbi:DUF6503 family protein [Aureitalea marina]|uniref:Deoxyribose-phosphate aldolase n=1 Tax=Aureitalea marina TaxID=930804 RepID=A0A2S7KQQ6_9FLAO|nr:DUF6503 family protein [Aureitalea marina]PQB04951.1 hypothetical protein BST85_08640 [Aureitalea marina]
MRLKNLLFILISSLLIACGQEHKNEISAQQIIERSIESYGGEAFFNSVVSFEVDDLKYNLIRKDHITDFTVSRLKDSMDLVGRYQNGLLEYYVDGELQELGTYNLRILRGKLDGFTYMNSIPHILIQNAITLTRMADVTIRNKPQLVVEAKWLKIEDQDQDILYLYLDPETYRINYTAEQLEVTGGYPQFKRYFNFQEVNGLLFADYYSFARKDSVELDKMYQRFELADLRELDQINLKDIEVIYP